jgi:hypothetical protein
VTDTKYMFVGDPGPDVLIVDAAPPATVLTDTGTLFVAGLSDRGLASGQVAADDVVHSLSEWVTKYGALQSYNGNEYATVEAFFAEGGTRLFFSRTSARRRQGHRRRPRASSKFTATAKGPGAYGNNLKVGVDLGVITVKSARPSSRRPRPRRHVAAAQAWARDLSDLHRHHAARDRRAGQQRRRRAGRRRRRPHEHHRHRAPDGARPVRQGPRPRPGPRMPGDTRTAAHQMLAQHALDRNRFALGDAPTARPPRPSPPRARRPRARPRPRPAHPAPRARGSSPRARPPGPPARSRRPACTPASAPASTPPATPTGPSPAAPASAASRSP